MLRNRHRICIDVEDHCELAQIRREKGSAFTQRARRPSRTGVRMRASVEPVGNAGVAHAGRGAFRLDLRAPATVQTVSQRP